MADQSMQVAWNVTGLTVYFFRKRPSDGFYFNTATPAYEAFNASNWSHYAIAATEDAGTGIYRAAVPAGDNSAELVNYYARIQAGGTPVVSPATDTPIGSGYNSWNGSADVMVGDIYQSVFTGSAPGASAGLMIAGTNSGPWTVTGGVTFTGGTSAAALTLTGGSSSGEGLHVSTTDGHGVNIVVQQNTLRRHGILVTAPTATSTRQGGDALHLVGGNALTGSAAGNGLYAIGGTASTSAGGLAGQAVYGIGGSGAASTNGAAVGVIFSGGGTNTVASAAHGLQCVGVSTGNDFEAQTTNSLQVNATAINAVSTSSVTTINANIGTTQVLTFDGNNLLKTDLEDIRGTASFGAAGYVGIDWGHVNSPTTAVVLANSVIGTATNLTNLPSIPNNWLTAAGIAASALNGKGDWITSASLPTNFASLGITAAGKVSEVVLTDTLMTYTGNTPQTGDAYARIGASGAGLTSVVLASAGLDSILAESGIAAGPGLVNDASTQLTSINIRQAIAILLSALAGKLDDPLGPNTHTFPAALPGSPARITAAVDQNSGRTSVNLQVPT
jgi:hypothetical protein